MSEIDIPRLRQDAHALLDDPHTAWLATAVLRILEDPSLITPEGWFMARKPDLLNKGINDRRDMT